MKGFGALFLWVFCFGSAFGQSHAISDIPLQSLIERGESIVREDKIWIEIKSPSRMVVKQKKAITYMTETSDHLTPVLDYDDHSDIKHFELRIYDGAGSLIQEYKKRDIQDVAHLTYSIYQDQRLQYFNVGKFDFPLTVEYEYEKQYKGIMSFQPWPIQKYDQSIQEASCTIQVPGDIELFYRLENLELTPDVSDSGRDKIYHWVIKDLPAVSSEPFSPHRYNLLPSLQYGTNRFEIDHYEGSYRNWSSFGTFLQQFYEGAGELPTAVKEDLDKIAKECETDQDKIRRLYDYLQEKTRYVSVQIGIGGWKTYDAQYVAEHQYGDCKALSNYMGSMLEYCGIEALPVIIERGDKPYELSNDFVFNHFNHAILYVPDHDQFIECTADSGPEGYLGASNEGRKALLVKGSQSRIVVTPVTPLHKNLIRSQSTITLQENGMAQVSTQQENHCHRQDYLRHKIISDDAISFEKAFRRDFPITIRELSHFQYTAEDEEPVVRLNYELESREIATSLGKRLFVNINPLFQNSIHFPENEERDLPIVMTSYGIDSNLYVFQLPEGYRPESMPDSPIYIESEWGVYHLAFEFVNDEELRVERVFSFKRLDQPATSYPSIQSFYEQVSQADKNTKIVLVRQ